jgi:hypothetical protein
MRAQRRNHAPRAVVATWLVAALAAGCGSAEPTPATPADDAASTPASPAGNGMGVQSEIGALDEQKVQQTFSRASQQLSRCFAKGVQRIPYMGGEIRFKVRVKEDGAARWAYVKDSTLGDHDTEACMVEALRSTSWPAPVGGEGLAENSFTFEPSSDERPPVAWTPEQLGKPYKQAQRALAACRRKAQSPLKATLYIDTDGKPLSVGVSTADERGDHAIPCVIEALRELTFPSPGSYASKVSIEID